MAMLFKKVFKYCTALFFFACSSCSVQAQSKGIEAIESALKEKNTEKASQLLQSIIDVYYTEGNADSLVNYIFYVGKIDQAKAGTDEAIKKVKRFLEKIKSLSTNPATLRQAYIEAGEYYGSAGLNKQGYLANQLALQYTLSIPDKTGATLALIENNLSTYAQRLGDISLSKSHTRQALKYLLSDKDPNYEALYISYNGMAAAMWYSSKTDSALYYYNSALAALEKTPRTPRNQFYRLAIIQNNLSGLYQLEGKTTDAIKALTATIQNLKSFLASKGTDTKKTSAITFQLEATDNLAGIYKELGDMRKAQQLLEYSYQQKQEHLPPDNPAIFISRILLGQLYFGQRDYDKSTVFLNLGLKQISNAEGDYLIWQADACNTLALLYDAKHDINKAAYFYEKADSLYEASSQGEYDNIYLDFLRNVALFYAENGRSKEAIAKANRGYLYVAKNDGAATLPAFYQLLNLSEVYFLSRQFKESLNYSNRSLVVVNEELSTSNNLLDSIRMEAKKPKAILQKGKATYELLPKKDVASLAAILNEMNAALLILERQKTILSDPSDIGLLIADHSALLDFIKKLNYDLYGITKDQTYIDRIVSLHESGVYNRIRSRLDKNDSLQFSNVPASIRLNERNLKAAISQALEGNDSHDVKMQRYVNAIEKRNQFQEKLRIEQPRYYNLRYASIFKSLDSIQQIIPEKTTLIRYFFIDKKLFALVADRGQKEIYPINDSALAERITAFSKDGMNSEVVSEVLYNLYQQLWAPIANSIRFKKVVIIPDGILYNINFEILTPTHIQNFKELAGKSLLANYTISYQYSLFLLKAQKQTPLTVNNFVAFAPGFSDKIKEAYRSFSSDSMDIDLHYLSLLPQPFSIGLAKNTQSLFGGETFIDEHSTKNAFNANAGNHQIIHIGTHAESNNDHPEFSRLIFAKSTSANQDDNSLFVEDIYNCNLTSNLAVLTACESGKPGYQDGEGMISLAHAFNYAGSESILTGLWEIDEQASAIIVESFYKQLLLGLPKDEALRNAKLNYLKNAEGRMLAPQYWAGLVIMGDTSPIAFTQKTSQQSLIIFAALFILLAFGGWYFFKQKRKLHTLS